MSNFYLEAKRCVECGGAIVSSDISHTRQHLSCSRKSCKNNKGEIIKNDEDYPNWVVDA